MESSHKSINTQNRRKGKDGSIMVDAAICLPIFIIAVAMLLQIINIVSKEENAYFVAETNIQSVGTFGSNLNVGITVNDSKRKVYIDHVQIYPIIKNVKFPFGGAIFNSELLSMDMPYRVYIGESPDIYNDDELVYIFPKNEGNEKEAAKYHTSYCRTMKAGATKGLSIERVSKSEAISRGYGLCKWCQREEN